MKHLHGFLYILILSSFASYGQNVYPHFSELNGMEDYNNNTNLLYRIYSQDQTMYNNNTGNNIYLLNQVDKVDTIFQLDYSSYNEYTGGQWRSVTGYDFWEKNPRKYIVSGSHGSTDGSPYVERFDNVHITVPFFGAGDFIAISRQHDSLVYASFHDGILHRSNNGGIIWDTAGNFNAVSLCPYNDKILYTTDHSKIIKTVDGGVTKIVVDSLPLDVYRDASFYYDHDTNYTYCSDVYYTDHLVYNFLVSNNSGNPNSWQLKSTSNSPIYVSVDNAVAGSVYIAAGKDIWHSTNFGNSFTLVPAFDRNIVGIYKKPGSSKLYAATSNTIYELDGLDLNIIKQIPVDPEIFKFEPLDVGNKWYYKTHQSGNGVLYKEVVQDTLLSNQKKFRQIKQQLFDSSFGYVSYSYVRIDTLTGDVYGWGTDSTEHILDNLNHNPGDTYHPSSYFGAEIVFDSLKSVSLFGFPTDVRVYSVVAPYGVEHYYLAKNFGPSYLSREFESSVITNELKGAVIKGIVYGDTSTVVGIADKYPNLPDKYSLSQNYPNPFNPSTTINYSVPKAGQVKLTVYNALGSKVATVLNEYKPAGNYSVQFNASSLASGIYFYRLESGQFTQIKKMMFIK